jgi:eukaryotic-like serine/threonine-protein kinase
MEDAGRTLVAGYRLDRYELLAPIASGGMASVWLAKLRGKRGFEKLFAIKTIKTELTTDARFQEMFLDEARIASGIQHPNVAQILDLGEQDDVLYIVMEWVDGESLAKVRRLAEKNGTPIPLGIALRIVADACAGLHAAHELCDKHGKRLGVVHRDVSPQNVLVSAAGSVKVIDFGVAKAQGRFAQETQGGIVKGKIRYMAPEQAHGQAIDRRADIWAVGVCLHEIVTGNLPFDGDSDVDVIRRLMSDEAPPRPGGSIPEALREILVHSLVRSPDERFATAAAMQRALEKAIDELGLPSTNEDVADFLRENLRDLESKRREAITKALSASESRELEKGAPRSLPEPDDDALAPTAVADRGSLSKPKVSTSSSTDETKSSRSKEKEKTQATKKRKRPRPNGRSASDDSKVTPAVTDADEAAPKRGGGAFWVAALLAGAAAGAWFVWPGSSWLLATFGSGAAPEPLPAPARQATPDRRGEDRPAATGAPSSTASAEPVATASASATATPEASAAAPDAPASASASATAPASAPSSGRPPPGRRGRSRDKEWQPNPELPEDPSPYE